MNSPFGDEGGTWHQAVQYVSETRVGAGSILSVAASHDTYSFRFRPVVPWAEGDEGGAEKASLAPSDSRVIAGDVVGRVFGKTGSTDTAALAPHDAHMDPRRAEPTGAGLRIEGENKTDPEEGATADKMKTKDKDGECPTDVWETTAQRHAGCGEIGRGLRPTDVPLVDASWLSQLRSMEGVGKNLTKAVIQNPIEYRKASRVAIALAAEPDHAGVDALEASRFCAKLMS